MTLQAGTKLGPYEILAPLGAGGMGEVYRALDPRLGRDVAIKVLPQHLSANPEVRTRFEREAKTVSSLNHPHICTLHDVGREGETDYLVMELIDGETLAARIARGALPAPEVLRLGMQIADALDRAHRAGVIHRDLKPGNVMLTKSGAKLMDFGLARATGMAGTGGGSGVSVAALTQSPTVAAPLTAEGTIVGTFQYMAPEQLEGKEADARTDLWSFGCLLYEMATGKRAFEGKSQASLISSIMSSEPAPLSQLAPMSPPGLEKLVRACLAKEADERIQTAHDVKLQLQWIAEGGSQAGVPAPLAARRRGRERLAWTLFAAAALVAVVFIGLALRPRPGPKSVIFELTPPHQVSLVDLPRISPDGRRLAFNATDSSGASAIWVRQMSSLDAQRMPGTEGATRPFWSPDSRFLAFFSGGKLHKIDIAGGPPQTVCDAPRGADGSWGVGDVILFDGSSVVDTVQRVSALGGVPVGATTVDRSKQEVFTAWPQFLPDGQHFLFIAYGATGDERTLKVGRLGSMETKSLGPAGSRTEYVSRHLLFVRQGTLLAQPFDPGSLKTTGDPVPVAENVEFDAVGSARFSASGEGTLVYRSGGSGAAERLAWVNRRGERTGTVGGPNGYDDPALSPDETQLAVKVTEATSANGNIWVWDLSRDLGSRFTFAQGDVDDAMWSPDGSRIAYSMARGTGNDLYVKSLGGSGADSLLLASNEQKFAEMWSPDGKVITYIMRSGLTNRRWDIYGLILGDSVRARPIVATPFAEYDPQLSADGKWMAYVSRESGDAEIYVQAFPGPGGKWRISTHGGTEPRWRGDGHELFYLGLDRKMFSVPVTPGTPPHFSLPERLFDAPVVVDANTRNRYVVTRDGQRFLMVTPEGEAKLGATTVVLDWLGRLSAR
jgi:serine/threonine protein kinase/dipeptidyl aminopeptidase/acylaminoacyl peptidase